MKYRIKIFGIIVGFILISFIVFRLFFMGYYYDFLEYWTLSDKIIWSSDEKLTWNDFYENGDGLYAKVGLSARYNVNDPILFRSKTVFIPEESYVSDTTDMINLRIAQAKFDLLEIYRRKMVKEVDSLRKINNNNKRTSYFKKMNQRYYDLFKLEWEKVFKEESEIESLEKLEKRIREVLN
ncbi:hypothetical protein ACJD0Z_12550 [Flavobacteriaceae bacterium M23B6Z8]